jgi:hypothetical protein
MGPLLDSTAYAEDDDPYAHLRGEEKHSESQDDLQVPIQPKASIPSEVTFKSVARQILERRPGLLEWQRWTSNDTGNKVKALDHKRFRDIVADTPWEFLESLANSKNQAALSIYLANSLARKDNNEFTSNQPFPMGPAPILKRTNPRTKRREPILQRGSQYCFLSDIPNLKPQEWQKLVDQAQAEIILRLTPAFFMTLYAHKRDTWEVSNDPKLNNSYRAHMQDCTVTTESSTSSYSSIQLGRAQVCTLRLLSSLAHSYMIGTYQKLTVEQLLCYEASTLCRKTNCLRHCVLESELAIVARCGCKGTLLGPDLQTVRTCVHDPPCLRLSKSEQQQHRVSWNSTDGVPLVLNDDNDDQCLECALLCSIL